MFSVLLTCEGFENEGRRLLLIVGRRLLHLTVHIRHGGERKEWKGEDDDEQAKN